MHFSKIRGGGHALVTCFFPSAVSDTQAIVKPPISESEKRRRNVPPGFECNDS